MPNLTFTLDTTQFEQAAKYVFENTRRSLPDIINRAALVTIIGGKNVEGAMQRTRRAAASAIRSVPTKAVAAYVAKKHAGQKLSKEQLKGLVAKEYRRRISAIGYTAVVGWNKAAVDLGGRGTKGHGGKGYASLGYARPATYGHYEAEIANFAPAASLIGGQALQDALDNTAQDMVAFWEEKTGVAFNP